MNNNTHQPTEPATAAEKDRAERLENHLYKNFGERFGVPKEDWLKEVAEIQDEMRAGKLSR